MPAAAAVGAVSALLMREHRLPAVSVFGVTVARATAGSES